MQRPTPPVSRLNIGLGRKRRVKGDLLSYWANGRRAIGVIKARSVRYVEFVISIEFASNEESIRNESLESV